MIVSRKLPHPWTKSNLANNDVITDERDDHDAGV